MSLTLTLAHCHVDIFVVSFVNVNIFTFYIGHSRFNWKISTQEEFTMHCRTHPPWVRVTRLIHSLKVSNVTALQSRGCITSPVRPFPTTGYYHPQRSWGKVMFLHVSVILFTGGSAPLHAGIHPPGPEPGTPLGPGTPPGTVHILLECILVIFKSVILISWGTSETVLLPKSITRLTCRKVTSKHADA